MTSKQRAYLKSLAMKIDPIYNIGKGSISPELVQGVRDALEARELIKIGVLQNCFLSLPFLSKRTIPSTNANNVSSPPRPTLTPG